MSNHHAMGGLATRFWSRATLVVCLSACSAASPDGDDRGGTEATAGAGRGDRAAAGATPDAPRGGSGGKDDPPPTSDDPSSLRVDLGADRQVETAAVEVRAAVDNFTNEPLGLSCEVPASSLLVTATPSRDNAGCDVRAARNGVYVVTVIAQAGATRASDSVVLTFESASHTYAGGIEQDGQGQSGVPVQARWLPTGATIERVSSDGTGAFRIGDVIAPDSEIELVVGD